ncbi:gag-pol polyprotein [Tanacetum coccineum]
MDSNNYYSSSDDDSYKNIDYVDASPPDAEIVSLEVVEIVILQVGGIDDDILLTIKDDILREKLLNISNYSLLDYEAFYLDDNHIEKKSSGSTTTHADFSQYDSFIFDLSIDSFPPADRVIYIMRSSPVNLLTSYLHQSTGYSLKDKNEAKSDKTEHGIGKSAKNQGQSLWVKRLVVRKDLVVESLVRKVAGASAQYIGRISFFTSKGIIINALELLALSHDDVPILLRDIGILCTGAEMLCSRKCRAFRIKLVCRNVVHGSDSPKERAIGKDHCFGESCADTLCNSHAISTITYSALQAEPGTIREDLAVQTGRNVVHGSDSPKERAIASISISEDYASGAICKYEIASKVITTLIMRAVKACEVERRESKVKTTISENKSEISRVTMH